MTNNSKNIPACRQKKQKINNQDIFLSPPRLLSFLDHHCWTNRCPQTSNPYSMDRRHSHPQYLRGRHSAVLHPPLLLYILRRRGRWYVRQPPPSRSTHSTSSSSSTSILPITSTYRRIATHTSPLPPSIWTFNHNRTQQSRSLLLLLLLL